MTGVEQRGIPGQMRSNRSQEVPRAGLRALPGGLSTGLPEAPHGSEFAREGSVIDVPASLVDGPASVTDGPVSVIKRFSECDRWSCDCDLQETQDVLPWNRLIHKN